MLEIGAALRFPTHKEAAWKTILVGGVVTVALPLVLFLLGTAGASRLGLGNNVGGGLVLAGVTLPYLFLLGYLVRVLRVSGEPDASAPSFTPITNLLADGLRGFGVLVGYLALPYGLLGVLVVLGLQRSQPLFAVFQGASLPILVLSWGIVILLLVALYLLPAALANMARHGELRQGFALSEIVPRAVSVRYFKAFVVAVVIYAVGNAISQVLLFLLLGAFTLFWVTVVAFYLLGRGYAEAHGDTVEDVAV